MPQIKLSEKNFSKGTSFNKTPAQAFTPPGKQRMGTSGHLYITAQAGET